MANQKEQFANAKVKNANGRAKIKAEGTKAKLRMAKPNAKSMAMKGAASSCAVVDAGGGHLVPVVATVGTGGHCAAARAQRRALRPPVLCVS